ncbi:HTH domain-containing protein [Brevibacillus agri]|uniref:helix-turn-helix transcriptional regulator n=1 Tax=Brevibacillus agri TaxID=51101 RepID=UPI00286FED84|nr:DeoR family transcriptional regulator [Brevibacillus agri]MDR9505224.1 HTH domain-containing protein [Brevibacillus agri]
MGAAAFREPTTRQKLLLYMKKHGTVSVQELAEHLRITKVAVRKHLDVLHRERYLDAQIMRRQVGRPVFVYQLTPRAERLFPTEYEGLAVELLGDMGDLFGDSLVHALFEQARALGRNGTQPGSAVFLEPGSLAADGKQRAQNERQQRLERPQSGAKRPCLQDQPGR